MKDNKQPMMSALNAQQLTAQFEEIVSYYQSLLDQAVREKQDAVVQAELAKAKARSLEAERDSLADSLRVQGTAAAGTPSTDAQRISVLEAERDNLQAALKSADRRIRELEAELNMMKTRQAAQAAPEAAVEPAPAVEPEPAAETEVKPGPAPAEPAAAPAPAGPEAAPEAAVEPEPAVDPAPAGPETEREEELDFEEQKEMLRRMEEELAILEARLKRGS